jgi:hypothetical protein
MIQEITENSQSRKRHTRTVSRSGNGVGSGTSMQNGNTSKVITLTQLQACPKKLQKKKKKLFEQTTYTALNNEGFILYVSQTEHKKNKNKIYLG